MGCGRVGILLTQELSKAGHEITVIDKNAAAFSRLPPGFEARTIVGLGFDRDVLEDAGIKEADAFLAVSSGDNSNILSARVARETYHVPKVIARIYDLIRMRVEIPSHLVGKPVSSLNLEGKILVAGVDRGGKGFIPVASSTFQEGDYAAVIVQKDALETLED